MSADNDDTIGEEYARLIARMEREITGFRIAFKDDDPATMPWHHRVAHGFARRVVPEYDTRFTTVLAPVVYLPKGQRGAYGRTPEDWYEVMRHEYIHLADAKRHPLWMPFSYVLCLPFFITMRAFWELRGYAQTMLVRYERGLDLDGAFFERMVEIFAGRSYLFMLWPRPLARVVLTNLKRRIEAGEVAGLDAEVFWRRDFIAPMWRRLWRR